MATQQEIDAKIAMIDSATDASSVKGSDEAMVLDFLNNKQKDIRKPGAVNGEMLADGAVTTPKLADGAVTTDKLNNYAVTTDKIATAAVTNDKIASAAIRTDNIASASVTNDKIATYAVTTNAIASKAVTEAKLSAEVQEKLNSKVYAERITYKALVAKRNAGQLVPGMQYRITDYRATTTQANTRALGHSFGIIVVADSANRLNENARAVRESEQEAYFMNSNLEAWVIRYCLDNDTTRFAWANAATGTGVIYFMRDEHGNECGYDFKNIQFKRWKITAYEWGEHFKNRYMAYATTMSYMTIAASDYGWAYTFSTEPDMTGSSEDCSLTETWNVNDNIIKEYRENNIQYLNNIVFYRKECRCNYIGYKSKDMTFGNFCYSNKFGDNCRSIIFGNEARYNTLGSDCFDHTFGTNACYNVIGDACYWILVGDYCKVNSIGNYCFYIRIHANYPSATMYCENCHIKSYNRYVDLYANKGEGHAADFIGRNYIIEAHTCTAQEGPHYSVALNADDYLMTTVARNHRNNIIKFCVADLVG